MVLEIQIVSDLHIDINKINTFDKVIVPKAKYIALCGDLTNNVQSRKYTELLEYCQKEFIGVFVITGNHEYYGSTKSNKKNRLNIVQIDEYIQKLCDDLNTEHPELGILHFMQNSEVIIDVPVTDVSSKKYSILGSTLWSYIPKNKEHNIIKSIADYQYILDENNNRFMTDYSTKLFMQNQYYLTNKIKDNETNGIPTVVLTHHAPIMEAVNVAYPDSVLNNAFASDLRSFIGKCKYLKCWMYGHTHYKFDIMIGNCRIVTNPRGYHSNEISRYSTEEVIVIEHE